MYRMLVEREGKKEACLLLDVRYESVWWERRGSKRFAVAINVSILLLGLHLRRAVNPAGVPNGEFWAVLSRFLGRFEQTFCESAVRRPRIAGKTGETRGFWPKIQEPARIGD